MLVLSIVLGTLLISVGLIQQAMVTHFSLSMRRGSRTPNPSPPISAWPKAAVIISLRGDDDSLEHCLRGLIRQDYPDYTLHIIVDSAEDPAWRIAEQVVAEGNAAHVRLSPLELKRPTCSLKCSALIQGVSEVEASHSIVAFVDADVLPHPTWLRELVEPLAADPRIGATSGNRWFTAIPGSWGSYSRTTWSAGAIVQMFVLKIAWGGTLATRPELLRESGLLEKWSKSFNDDLLVGDLVQSRGLEMRYVPSLIMVNRDDCTVPNMISWLTRQLFHVRHYHRAWLPLVIFGMMMTVTIPCAIVAGLLGVATGQFAAAAWAWGGFAVYLAIMVSLYLQVQRTVRIVLQDRHQDLYWRFGLPRLAAAIALSHWVYGRALFSTIFRRDIAWRGVTYRVHGPWRVELLEYRPYQPAVVTPVAEGSR